MNFLQVARHFKGRRCNLIILSAIFIIFFVFCFVPFKYFSRNGEAYDTLKYDANLVKISIDSINLGLDFFSNVEEGDIVFDVLIALRIVIEQSRLISSYLTRKDGFKNLLGTFDEMTKKSKDLFDKIFDALMRTQVNNMNNIGHMIAPNSWSHWTLDSLCVNSSLIYEHNISINDSGRVYMGLSECLEQYKHKCLIDDRCWNIMSEPGAQLYELSHQLMYTMLAEKYGCNERMNYHINKSGQVSLLNLQTILCSNMFDETTKLPQLAEESPSSWYKDLLMENVAFCGILGFHQFTNNKEWVWNIINWQDRSGCWTYDPNADHKNIRKKRSDSLVGDNNCSLHMTTVAIGAIIVNIKNEFIQLFESSKYNCKI